MADPKRRANLLHDILYTHLYEEVEDFMKEDLTVDELDSKINAAMDKYDAAWKTLKAYYNPIVQKAEEEEEEE